MDPFSIIRNLHLRVVGALVVLDFSFKKKKKKEGTRVGSINNFVQRERKIFRYVRPIVTDQRYTPPLSCQAPLSAGYKELIRQRDEFILREFHSTIPFVVDRTEENSSPLFFIIIIIIREIIKRRVKYTENVRKKLCVLVVEYNVRYGG